MYMKKLFMLCIAMLLPLCSISAQNDCATAVPITSIPFASGTKTTCGTGNDYGAGTFVSNYGGGEDYVYSITITNAPVDLKLTLGGAATWKVASVHSACPPSLTNSIGAVKTSSGSTGSGIINFPTNGTYYIIIDTWPDPACGEFTLKVDPAPLAPSCATLASPANGTTASSINPVLSWNAPASGPAPSSYKVYVGTTNPPTTLAGTVTAPTTTFTANLTNYNTTYYWYVVPNNGGIDATGCNAIVWSFTTPAPPPPPSNDNCSGAVSLTVNNDYSCTSKTAGTTHSATASTETAPSCGASGTNDDVWYKFTATAIKHRVTLTNISNTTDMAMAVYSGTCGSLTQVSCSDPNTLDLTNLTIGTEYFVRVWTYTSTATTRATFDICVGTQPPVPANDDCSGAINATPAGTTPYTFTQDASSATNNAGYITTCSAGSSGGMNDGVWFMVAGDGSSMTVNISPTGWDAEVGIFSGTCGNFTCVGTVDDGDSGEAESITFMTAAGVNYYINVGHYSDFSNGSEGPFTITVTSSGILSTNEIVKNNDNVKGYPNPFTDVLNISDVKNVGSIAVMDVSGKLVKTFTKPESVLHLSELKSGIYLVVLTMKDGSKQTIKAIKK